MDIEDIKKEKINYILKPEGKEMIDYKMNKGMPISKRIFGMVFPLPENLQPMPLPHAADNTLILKGRMILIIAAVATA